MLRFCINEAIMALWNSQGLKLAIVSPKSTVFCFKASSIFNKNQPTFPIIIIVPLPYKCVAVTYPKVLSSTCTLCQLTRRKALVIAMSWHARANHLPLTTPTKESMLWDWSVMQLPYIILRLLSRFFPDTNCLRLSFLQTELEAKTSMLMIYSIIK